MRLALPHQQFTFSYNELNLLDDPTLAAAFSVSLRTAFAEVPNAVTTPRGEGARACSTFKGWRGGQGWHIGGKER